jgi:hypothetical protein
LMKFIRGFNYIISMKLSNYKYLSITKTDYFQNLCKNPLNYRLYFKFMRGSNYINLDELSYYKYLSITSPSKRGDRNKLKFR